MERRPTSYLPGFTGDYHYTDLDVVEKMTEEWEPRAPFEIEKTGMLTLSYSKHDDNPHFTVKTGIRSKAFINSHNNHNFFKPDFRRIQPCFKRK